MNLLDAFFYELDGATAAQGDAATLALDQALARVGTLTPVERHQLRTELHVIWLSTDLELTRVDARRSELLAEIESWSRRAVTETTPTLQSTAASRLADAREALAAVEQERAEYQATIDRLEQIRTLLGS